MHYTCISADCHIDLPWLPYDLFVSNASPSLKERMPYVEQTPDGPKWRTKAVPNLGFANGGAVGSIGHGSSIYVPGKIDRLDRMAATGLFADGSHGKFRPTTPKLRIEDQDRDGLQAEVLYGLLGSGSKLSDRDAEVEFYRIYNEWLADFCAYDRRRLVGLASIPGHSVELAVEETRRVAKLGLAGLDFRVSYDMIPLWNPYWDPLWQAAESYKLPVHFHTLGPPPEAPVPEGLAESFRAASGATRAASFQLFMAQILASMINGGALERYSRLRIVFGESGIGWIPYVLDRMDFEYEGRFKTLALKMKPSEYWRRQCRATFQYDRIGAKLLDDLGVENVMWGSNYPHADGVFPDSQEYIARQFKTLPDEVVRKIVCRNVAEFYGLA